MGGVGAAPRCGAGQPESTRLEHVLTVPCLILTFGSYNLVTPYDLAYLILYLHLTVLSHIPVHYHTTQSTKSTTLELGLNVTNARRKLSTPDDNLWITILMAQAKPSELSPNDKFVQAFSDKVGGKHPFLTKVSSLMFGQFRHIGGNRSAQEQRCTRR